MSIQSSINSMIGSVGASVAVAKGIKLAKEQSALNKVKAAEHAEERASKLAKEKAQTDLLNEKIKTQKLQNKQLRLTAKEAKQRAFEHMRNAQEEKRARMQNDLLAMPTSLGGTVGELPEHVQKAILTQLSGGK